MSEGWSDKEKQDETFFELQHDHVESAAVHSVYARKVYLFNKIINEDIGMNSWQWGLLCVCGMGWFLDNAWLQLIALILPQVQVEFFSTEFADAHVFSAHPAWVTLSMFFGTLLGSIFWGWAADVVGRRLSFNATLFMCAVFGIAAGGAPNFRTLNVLIGLSAFGIGGSLPVDGMLFLEFLPGKHQYLLTLLSVFWPIGQLVTSLIGWGFIAGWHCTTHEECPARSSQSWMQGNEGWRYLLFTTGAYMFAMFFVRFLVFRIPESPKFYLSKGRDAEAVRAMHEFARMCGKPLPEGYLTVAKLRQAAAEEPDPEAEKQLLEPSKGLGGYVKHFMADMGHNFRHSQQLSPVAQLRPLFSTFALGYTTVMTWLMWLLIGLAYPLFNAFILLYLGGSGNTTLSDTYRDYVVISVCGVPGSVLAAWMVTWPRAGRRGAMSIGTILSGVFLFIFIVAGDSHARQLAFFSVTNFFENIMYGVLYCYTPESFPAPLRGTADGIASTLNRGMGCVSTLIKIYTSNQSTTSAPLYTSASLFVAAGVLMLTLRVETANRTAL